MPLKNIKINAKKQIELYDWKEILKLFTFRVNIVDDLDTALKGKTIKGEEGLREHYRDIDNFHAYYLRYLFGDKVNLGTVYDIITMLSKDEEFNNEVFFSYMEVIFMFLERHEMYESLVLFKHSRLKIFKRFNMKLEDFDKYLDKNK